MISLVLTVNIFGTNIRVITVLSTGMIMVLKNIPVKHPAKEIFMHETRPVKYFNKIEKGKSFSKKASCQTGSHLEIGLFEYDPMASARSRFSEIAKQKKGALSPDLNEGLEDERLRRVPGYSRGVGKRALAFEIAAALVGQFASHVESDAHACKHVRCAVQPFVVWQVKAATAHAELSHPGAQFV